MPGSELAREREGLGAKGPGSESSRERIGQGPIGRFAPGSELARERKGSVSVAYTCEDHTNALESAVEVLQTNTSSLCKSETISYILFFRHNLNDVPNQLQKRKTIFVFVES